MTAVLIRGKAQELPLPDGSVDLIVTSPPYFGLRSYTDNVECAGCVAMRCEGRDVRQAWPDYDTHVREVHIRHYEGQIGSEATPAEFLAALLDCTREWVRVLKPSGSLFVNLGDSYANKADGAAGATWRADRADVLPGRLNTCGAAPRKSLIGMPWRYALSCVDQLGLTLRAEIVWAKTNGMPESVTDRVRRSHEQLFHFTRQPHYYSAVDEIREPHTMRPQRRPAGRPLDTRPRQSQPRQSWTTAQRDDVGVDGHPLGKLPDSVWEVPAGESAVRVILRAMTAGALTLDEAACMITAGDDAQAGDDVWSIPSAPLKVPPRLGVDHFAAFPPALVRPIVQAWSPAGICLRCGEGRRPVVLADFDRQGRTTNGPQSVARRHESPGRDVRAVRTTTITGYACACPQPDAPTRPAIVFDPCGGTGTTAMVADVLGRTGISMDLSADYCRLARWRTRDPGERARALSVPKPPPVADGQQSLEFGGAA